jgi:hypothetical protein
VRSDGPGRDRPVAGLGFLQLGRITVQRVSDEGEQRPGETTPPIGRVERKAVSYTVGQALGMLVAIPLCFLVSLMMVAAARTFVLGWRGDELYALLAEAVSLRTWDGLEALSEEDLTRFRRMLTDGRARPVMHSAELELLDAVATAFAGKRDPAFATALREERNARQEQALERLRAQLRATPLARDVIHRWVWWTARENLRLVFLGIRRLGVDIVYRVVARTTTATAVTAAVGVFCAIALWVLALRSQPPFFDYVETGGAIGAVLGVAGGVFLVFKEAWDPFVAAVPEARRRAARVLAGVYAAFLAALGPFFYYDVTGLISDWPSHHVRVDIGDTFPLAVLFVVVVGWLLYAAALAFRATRAEGVPASKRLNDFGVMLFLGLLALAAAQLGVNALIVPVAGTAEVAFGWITIACMITSLVAWAASRIAARIERRRRMHRFAELGLEPRQLLPVWNLVMRWIAAIVTVSLVAFGLAMLAVAIAGPRHQIEIAKVAAIGWLGSISLCLISASFHVAIVRRRRRRDELRLIRESRWWLRDLQRPAQ